MANLISLLRVLLCLAVAAWLFVPDPTGYLWCFILTVIVIWMDGLDGYVARKFNEASRLGSVIDILGDRVVEQVYWVVFLALGWVPAWMPLVVIVRGVVVDGLRSLAFEQGYTAFGQTSMMASPLGTLLVSSRFSRFSYAIFKALAFSLMIWIQIAPLVGGHGLEAAGLSWAVSLQPALESITWFSVYATVFFCVVRGLPVILESPRFLKNTPPVQS